MVDDLRAVLALLPLPARDSLRRVLIRDQADRDAIAAMLLRYGDQAGAELGDVIDLLTIHPAERRRVVRVLRELEAES